ncbi:MAG: hypothetical protein QXI16_02655 [Sulfolobaceae archaeon]
MSERYYTLKVTVSDLRTLCALLRNEVWQVKFKNSNWSLEFQNKILETRKGLLKRIEDNLEFITQKNIKKGEQND